MRGCATVVAVETEIMRLVFLGAVMLVSCWTPAGAANAHDPPPNPIPGATVSCDDPAVNVSLSDEQSDRAGETGVPGFGTVRFRVRFEAKERPARGWFDLGVEHARTEAGDELAADCSSGDFYPSFSSPDCLDANESVIGGGRAGTWICVAGKLHDTGSIEIHASLRYAGDAATRVADLRKDSRFHGRYVIDGLDGAIEIAETGPLELTFAAPWDTLRALRHILCYDATGLPIQALGGYRGPSGTAAPIAVNVPVDRVDRLQIEFFDRKKVRPLHLVISVPYTAKAYPGTRSAKPPPTNVPASTDGAIRLSSRLLTDLTTMPIDAAAAHIEALKAWADGRQADTERYLERGTKKFPKDQGLLFFAACCTRSRFDIDGGDAMFEAARQLAPDTPRGQCAALMLALDRKQDVQANIHRFIDLVRAQPVDPLIPWMLGVQGRTQDQNEVGIWAFDSLLSRVDPGPVLVHQTFANLLDEAGLSEKALPHRYLAIQLERATWTMSALGDTLQRLHRYDDAAKAYADTVDFADDNEARSRWAWVLALGGRNADALAKADEALARDQNSVSALMAQAQAYENLGQRDRARTALKHLLSIDAHDAWATEHLKAIEQAASVPP